MRRLWIIVAVVFGVCAVLVAGVRQVRLAQPLSPTYLGAGSCEQPCWQGLVLGRDPVDHFLFRASQTPYSPHASDYGDGVTTMLELSTFGALSLGDTLREFGRPERVGCLGADHSSMFPGVTRVMAVSVYFAGGLIVVDAVRPDTVPRLSPDMRVRAVRFYAPGEPTYPVGGSVAWHGFATTHTYYLDCHG